MQRNILEYLEQTVQKYPEKTAFANETMGMTFSEVYRASRNIGSCLAEKGYAREPVVIYMKNTRIWSRRSGASYTAAVFMCLWMRRCRSSGLN